jgi:hypothetical protein
MSVPSSSILFNTLFARRRSAFAGMDAAEAAQALVACGHAGGLTVGTRTADRIVAEGGRDFMVNAHLRCPTVRGLARHSQVLAVARRYLEAEPCLHASYLVWSPPRYGRASHPEVVDLRALTLFVYLTDVDRDTSARQVVLGGGVRVETITGRRGTAWFADQTVLHRVLGVPTRECGTLILTYTSPPP